MPRRIPIGAGPHSGATEDRTPREASSGSRDRGDENLPAGHGEAGLKNRTSQTQHIISSGMPEQEFRTFVHFSTSIHMEFQPKGETNVRARILRISIGVALLLTGYMVGTHSSISIHAEQRTSVPRDYGRLVAGDSASLWFEDKDGTLRQVNVPQGNTVFTAYRNK